jgi:hypothetical protein
MKHIKGLLDEDLSGKMMAVSGADWDKNVPKIGRKIMKDQSNVLSIMSSN